ncbi:uncharacterized protein METZ01_LOCUS449896, partial [marine metagenome]
MDHFFGATREVGHSDTTLKRVGRAVNAASEITLEMQRCLALGLARNGAGVDAGTADDLFYFRQPQPPLAELGGLNGGALADRAGADYKEILIIALRH